MPWWLLVDGAMSLSQSKLLRPFFNRSNKIIGTERAASKSACILFPCPCVVVVLLVVRYALALHSSHIRHVHPRVLNIKHARSARIYSSPLDSIASNSTTSFFSSFHHLTHIMSDIYYSSSSTPPIQDASKLKSHNVGVEAAGGYEGVARSEVRASLLSFYFSFPRPWSWSSRGIRFMSRCPSHRGVSARLKRRGRAESREAKTSQEASGA
ncbi:hypothetical protein R3P38DRAFT_889593 [Favolaschia claudopus]|uniref:Uncharacterized protein n=1 Tax=Favolaschia claudopus TaxID=2862362 RepID=A0AAW0BUP1_9AGAR